MGPDRERSCTAGEEAEEAEAAAAAAAATARADDVEELLGDESSLVLSVDTSEAAEGLSREAAATACAAPSREDMNAFWVVAAAAEAASCAACCCCCAAAAAAAAAMALRCYLLLALTTHLRMCFSRVEGTLKGMSQKRHL